MAEISVAQVDSVAVRVYGEEGAADVNPGEHTTTLPAPGAPGGPALGSAALADPDELAVGLVRATRAQLALKRLLDILFSGGVLLLLSPLLLVTALVVKLTSAGPVLYVDERMGQDGRPFKMYKFRSMYHDATERRAALLGLNEATGPIFKIRSDPRITPVGRLMRKLSIDELPQLLNVLLGHMSLVGPRPPLPVEYDTYTPRQRQRLSVRPGITCIWQVSGRSNIPFDEWIELDLEYIRRWTVGLDMVLLLRTIPAVITGRGAY